MKLETKKTGILHIGITLISVAILVALAEVDLFLGLVLAFVFRANFFVMSAIVFIGSFIPFFYGFRWIYNGIVSGKFKKSFKSIMDFLSENFKKYKNFTPIR